MPPLSDDLGQLGVQRAYDTVAETYADYFPDTRAESPLELALVDAFAAAVTGSAGKEESLVLMRAGLAVGEPD